MINQECTMTQAGKVVHTAKPFTTGGRENGLTRSSDGRLDIRLSTPGSARIGTTPEHLFGGLVGLFRKRDCAGRSQKPVACTPSNGSA
jgi:hypothetical protein